MTDEAPSALRRRHPGRALVWGMISSGSAFLGLEVADFSAGVDGIGYGHYAVQTPVTWLVGVGVAAVVGLVVVALYRGWIGIIAGTALGGLLWVPVALLTIISLGPHYEHVCATMEAPRACMTGTFADDCSPERDEDCFDRLERACRLGHVPGCDRLVERDAWTEPQVCDALSDRCDQTRGCSERPGDCVSQALPRLERWVVAEVCEHYEQRCE